MTPIDSDEVAEADSMYSDCVADADGISTLLAADGEASARDMGWKCLWPGVAGFVAGRVPVTVGSKANRSQLGRVDRRLKQLLHVDILHRTRLHVLQGAVEGAVLEHLLLRHHAWPVSV